MAFRKSGTQDPRVEPYGGTLRWDTRVKARRTVFIHLKEIVLYPAY